MPTQSRELPALEPTLIFNTGAPIAIVDACGDRIEVGTGEAFYAGLHRRYCFSLSFGAQAGVQVRLSPAAAWRLLGSVAGACTDRAVPLAELAGGGIKHAVERFGMPTGVDDAQHVHCLLAAALVDATEPDDDLLWCLDLLAAPGARVDTVAQLLGWSRRRLVQHFTAFTGLSPKTYARIARFRRLLESGHDNGGNGWVSRSIDAGYYDQAHMIRDFTSFVGLPPTAFVKQR